MSIPRPNPFKNGPVLAGLLLAALAPASTGAIRTDDLMFEYGDAPEDYLAYPSSGQQGHFPTCFDPVGYYVRHANPGSYFGPSADLEVDGNAGLCFVEPYDQDECWGPLDGDSGLVKPTPFTVFNGTVVLCSQPPGTALGTVCGFAQWGTDIDIEVHNTFNFPQAVNILFDWDQDGSWHGQSQCNGGTPVPEHAVWNLQVPGNFSGLLSQLGPPAIQIGPNSGYVWVRFTITDPGAIPAPGWDGTGNFDTGETEDYLLRIDPIQEAAELGDAPEDVIAYPLTNIVGHFPTCYGGSAGYVRHANITNTHLGATVDLEPDGNHGECGFIPYDYDECGELIEAGLQIAQPYTIGLTGNIEQCAGTTGGNIGYPCDPMVWGTDFDVFVTNNRAEVMYLNVLADWNGDGTWGATVTCPSGIVGDEHPLKNAVIPGGFNASASSLSLPDFRILSGEQWVWFRITLSDMPVSLPWDGSGDFLYGETEDYLLRVGDAASAVPTAQEAGLILEPSFPNPFNPRTTIAYGLQKAGPVRVDILDPRGRRVVTLVQGDQDAGQHSVTWEGRDQSGRLVPSGVYMVSVTANGTVRTGKLSLLK